MLKPLDEILNFLYLNEIRTKDEHFNLATLSDKQSQKVYEIDSTNKLHVSSWKNFNLPKKAYNFKKEVKKHTFEHKNQ